MVQHPRWASRSNEMRTLLSERSRIITAVAVAVGAVAAVRVAPLPPGVRAALWGAAMLASFVGWGSVVSLWLARGRRTDWGLRAGWGLALFLVTGGFLCGLHLAVRPVLVAHVGFGVLALVLTWNRRTSVPRSWSTARRQVVRMVGHAGVFAIVAGAYGMAVFTFLAFLGNHAFQPSDDPPLYFTLAEKLVQTGSMFEPFMARRASLFGGKVYLDASFISLASIYYLHVVDGGISLVIVVGLLVGHIRSPTIKAWHAVPLGLTMLVLCTLEDVRVNTASLVSGLAAVLTLYRTVRVPLEPEPARPPSVLEPRRVVALAGLALSCILLRISNAPAVLLFIAFVFASDFALDTRWPWRRESMMRTVRVVGFFIGTFLLALLPWAILQKHSCGTFFYPFGHSNITPGWTFLATPDSVEKEGTELLSHLFYGKPVLFVPFVIAGLLPLAGRARNDLAALVLGSLVGLAVFSHQAVAFGPMNTARYYYAFVAGAALMAAASVERTGARAALVAAALGMHLAVTRDDTRAMLEEYVKNEYRAFAWNRGFSAQTTDYRNLQAHIPAGATMATAVLEGFRFDFKRNQIFALDVLGGMGPQPGWPAHKGPEALGEYLKANGVQYLVWVDFNVPNEFYNRDHWKSHLEKVGHYLQGEAVLQLDAEDSIEKLSAMRRVVYRANDMTVVDLASAP
jgi:hypothetical protein